MRDRMLGQPPEESDEFPLDNENASRRQMPVASQPPRPRDDEELNAQSRQQTVAGRGAGEVG